MKKLKMLVAVDSLMMGGIAKSLAAFVSYCMETCDIDVLVWRSSLPEEVRLPDGVNRICLPGTESVRAAYKSYGLFSLDFLVSLFSVFRKKRWLAIPRIKKKYDIAIAYSHVSNLKYYTIDKVKATKKYAFYHHGAYGFQGKTKLFDEEYYPRYDRVFAVSPFAKEILLRTFPDLDNVSIIPNLIDIESIQESAKAPCPEFPDDQRLKLLTVGRISPEKEPLSIVEAAKELMAKGIDFIWIVVGEGPLSEALHKAITESDLTGKVLLVGNQSNPYRFMSRCDCYVQFSRFEADSLTVKEAAVFSKPMVLSDIPQFRSSKKVYNDIILYRACDSFADILLEAVSRKPVKNDLLNINEETHRLISQIIISEVN